MPSSFFVNNPNTPNPPNPSNARTSFYEGSGQVYAQTSNILQVYYGPLAADPSLDPFGNTMITGATYFNTLSNTFKIWNGTNWQPYAATSTTIEFIIDGGGATISTGVAGYLEVPFSCTPTQWTLLAGNVGSIVVDIQRCSFGNFSPPTHPAASDSIVNSAPPTLSSQLSAQNTNLTGWQTLNQGDIIGMNVLSVTNTQRCTLSLKVIRI